MLRSILLPLFSLVLVAACESGGDGMNVSVSGSGAVGVSSGTSYTSYGGGGGPPPGRTASERQARRNYYSGPRGGR